MGRGTAGARERGAIRVIAKVTDSMVSDHREWHAGYRVPHARFGILHCKNNLVADLTNIIKTHL